MTDRQQEYIRLLEERNRLKRVLTEKTPEEQQKVELERGFSTHFRGAHASKEAAATKASNKPVVKVHKAPNLDLLSRLLPQGAGDGTASGGNSSRSTSRSRQGGRRPSLQQDEGNGPLLSHRSQWSQEEYDMNQMRADLEKEEYSNIAGDEDDAHNDYYVEEQQQQQQQQPVIMSSSSSDKIAAAPQPTGDIANALVGHIANMTPEQQLAILQLLQQTAPTTAIAPVANIAPSIQAPVQQHYEESKAKDVSEDDYGSRLDKRSVSNRSATALSVEEPPRIERESLQRAMSIPKTEPADMTPLLKLNVKLKIYSTWSLAKNTILQGIRLRLSASSGCYIDVLHCLKTKILSGLTSLPATSESYRTLPQLLGQSHRPAGSMWKAPLAQNPIELVFEGEVPGQIFKLTQCTSSKDVDNLRNSLEFNVWNGMKPLLDSTVNSSPAKDVDVFVDNKCVWSGELSEDTAYTDITRALDVVASLSRNEQDPSVRVKIYSSTTANSKTVRPKSGKEPEIAPTFSSPSRKAKVELPKKSNPLSPDPSKLMKQNDSDAQDTSGKPDWLRGAKTPNRSVTKLLPSPDRSSATSATANNDIASKLERMAAEGDKSSEHSKSARIRRRRDRDANKLGAIEEQGGQGSPGKPIMMQSTVDKRDNELNLRKSLDAIQHADKFNLNRLESQIAKSETRRRRRPDPSAMEGEALEDSLEASRAEMALVVEPSKSVDTLGPFPEDPNQKLEMSKTLDFSGRQNRINNVNEKLNSALSDLADIMAALPRNRSEKKMRTVSEVSKLNITTDDASLSDKQSPDVKPSKLELPAGKLLTFMIYSTYGDVNYVGMNGIELYDEKGQLLRLGQKISSIQALPSDLTLVPGYEDDPRKVINLLDGMNTTKDDLHQWLAPHAHIAKDYVDVSSLFEEDAIASVTIGFKDLQKISMIRIYNFNKSRTHNQRGVKLCKIKLDECILFEGEIKKASGQMKISDQDSQMIVLTSNQAIIDQVPSPIEKAGPDEMDLEESMSSPNARPKTAAGPATIVANDASTFELEKEELEASMIGSPGANFLNEVLQEVESIGLSAQRSKPQLLKSDSSVRALSSSRSNAAVTVMDRPSSIEADMPKAEVTYTTTNNANINNTANNTSLPAGSSTSHLILTATVQYLRFDLETSWGDRDYIGLNGLEVLGLDGKAIPIQARHITVDNANEMFGNAGSDRKPENLVNGINNTANDSFMWLTPIEGDPSKQRVEINLQHPRNISGFRFWNYNGSPDATLRGCKRCLVYLDNVLSLRCLLRPAPECDGVDYSQTILFEHYFTEMEQYHKFNRHRVPPSISYVTPKLKQIYEAVSPPCGLLWKFTFYNNHGDDYYIGLDCIDMYDGDNQIINVAKRGGHIGAVPHSVRDLSTSSSDTLANDPRTPEKMFLKGQGVISSKNCWLSPLAKCMTESEREAGVCRALQHGNSNMTEYHKKKRALLLPKENVVMVMFAYPTAVSAIRFFNYSKSTRRGVKDYSISVDNKLVYMGTLMRADEETKGFPETRGASRAAPAAGSSVSQGQAVVFNQDMKILNAHKDVITPAGLMEQDVLCINERQVMVRSKTMYEPPNSSAVVLDSATDLQKRPTTSYFS